MIQISIICMNFQVVLWSNSS